LQQKIEVYYIKTLCLGCALCGIEVVAKIYNRLTQTYQDA